MVTSTAKQDAIEEQPATYSAPDAANDCREARVWTNTNPLREPVHLTAS
jgi:hypothetical protein